jgi:hypothetical protein
MNKVCSYLVFAALGWWAWFQSVPESHAQESDHRCVERAYGATAYDPTQTTIRYCPGGRVERKTYNYYGKETGWEPLDNKKGAPLKWLAIQAEWTRNGTVHIKCSLVACEEDPRK